MPYVPPESNPDITSRMLVCLGHAARIIERRDLGLDVADFEFNMLADDLRDLRQFMPTLDQEIRLAQAVRGK